MTRKHTPQQGTAIAEPVHAPLALVEEPDQELFPTETEPEPQEWQGPPMDDPAERHTYRVLLRQGAYTDLSTAEANELSDHLLNEQGYGRKHRLDDLPPTMRQALLADRNEVEFEHEYMACQAPSCVQYRRGRDLAAADWKLPEFDGPQALREFNQMKAGNPVTS
jgi:hypothetical protein